MKSSTEDILRVCEGLPPEKQIEVADFARFLLAQFEDEKWERLISDQSPRPRLESFLRESAAEGEMPLDLNRL
jgi:hypothetical protein